PRVARRAAPARTPRARTGGTPGRAEGSMPRFVDSTMSPTLFVAGLNVSHEHFSVRRPAALLPYLPAWSIAGAGGFRIATPGIELRPRTTSGFSRLRIDTGTFGLPAPAVLA